MKTLHKDTVIVVGLILFGIALALNWVADINERTPAVSIDDIVQIERGMIALGDTNKVLAENLTVLGELIRKVEQSLLEEINERRRTEIERTIPLALKAIIHERIDSIRARYDAGHLSILEVAQEYEEIAKDMRNYKRDN